MGPKRVTTQPDRGATGGAVAEDDGGADPELSRIAEDATLQDLRDMFRTHLAQQQARDHETTRQWRNLHHQFSLLQQEVQERTAPDPGTDTEPGPDTLTVPVRGSSGLGARPASHPASRPASRPDSQGRGQVERGPRIPCLSDTDNVEHFLIMFERVATACQWPTTDWAVRLAPLLTGKARAAYVSMDQQDALHYAQVKGAILDKYNINQEMYRLQFRGARVDEEESPKELYIRLRDLYLRWVQPQYHTKEEVGETIILEQFLRLLSPDLQVWIRERNPDSATEAAAMADVFVAARRKTQPWTYAQWKDSRDSSRPPRQPQPENKSSADGKSVGEKGGPSKQSPAVKPSKVPVCYQCGEEGHIKPRCPQRDPDNACNCIGPRASVPKKPLVLPCHTVKLSEQEVSALLDTGSMQSLVSSEFVPAHLRNYSVMTQVRCVHGEERSYPTASVQIQVLGQAYLLEVGVVDTLPYQMILGQDFPLLCDLVPVSSNGNVVMTRAMTKASEPDSPLSALPFCNADIEAQPGKNRKSKQQRRQEKFKFGVADSPEELPPGQLEVFFQISQDIGGMRQEDSVIGPLYQQVQEE